MSTTVELGRMRDQRDAALVELAALRETIAADIEAYPKQTMVSCGCYANAAYIARHGADS